jgi:hypothetical protein
MRGIVVIALPRSVYRSSRVYKLSAVLDEQGPLAIRFQFAALPWWRCWFKRFQLKQGHA